MLQTSWQMNFEFFREIQLNGDAGGFVFFYGGLPEKGAQIFLGDETSIEAVVW